MSYSIVSSMALFLLLLLVFPRMDTALTTNKLSGANGEETTHPDQVTVQLPRIPFPFPRPRPRIPFPFPRPRPRFPHPHSHSPPPPRRYP